MKRGGVFIGLVLAASLGAFAYADSRREGAPVTLAARPRAAFAPAWQSVPLAARPRAAFAPAGQSVRFMTFNIWGDYFGNPVEERDTGILEVIVREKPDFVSLQEVTENWYASRLFAGAPKAGYALVRGDEEAALKRAFSDRDEGKRRKKKNWCNHEPLLYNASRYALLDSGVEFYHVRLQVEKSVTWGVFERAETKQRLIVFATHFWWKRGPESDALRELNAMRVVDVVNRVKAKWGDLPVMGGGDLNCEFEAMPHAILRQSGYKNAALVADVRDARPSEHGNPVRDAAGNYVGRLVQKGDEHATYLDHVYFSGALHAIRHAVIADPLALSLSDHSPVVVDFVLR